MNDDAMRKHYLAVLTGAVAGMCVLAGVLALPSREACSAPAQISYKEDLLPIFRGRCFSCHQPGGEGFEQSGLDLTTYQGLMKGTKFGPMVIPGDPDASNLMWLLDWRATPALRMPHGKKQLSTCDRDTIRTWILQGAKDN